MAGFIKNIFFYLGFNKNLDLFAEKILFYAASFISDRKIRINYLNSIPYIKQSKSAPQREKLFGWLYLDIENYLTNKETRRRYNKQGIRAKIRRRFRPSKHPSKFAILFLEETDRLIKIYAIFTEILLIRIQRLFEAERFLEVLKESSKTNFLKFVDFQKKPFVWEKLTKQFLQIKPDKEKNTSVKDYVILHFSDFFKKIIFTLLEKEGEEKTINEFEEALKSLKDECGYIEASSAVLLAIKDPKFFSEERATRLSKKDLAAAVRQRTIELELAKIKLEEKAERLERAVSDLRLAREKLLSLNKAKDDFIQVVSHQFRTPLSVIRWNAELASEQAKELDGSSGKEKEQEMFPMLETIRQKTAFLVDILDNIFDTLALENKSLFLNKKPVFLWEIANDLISENADLLKNKNLRIDLEKTQKQDRPLQADPQKIQKTIKILMLNAINYSAPNAEINVKITKNKEQEGEFIKFEIQNRGIGIEESDKDFIFSKFFRAQNAIAAMPDGAGLGLYLAKNLVEAHGGKIGFASEKISDGEPNKNVVFWFALPA